MSLQRIALAAFAPALVLAGCLLPPQYNAFTRSFTISGGQSIEFTFSGGTIVAAEDPDVKIESSSFVIDAPPKTIVYGFSFLSKSGRPPRSVMVEDVSDAKAEILVEDDSPVLTANRWHRTSGPKTDSDPRLGWLNEPDQTFRIYRFTVVTGDGRKIVMYGAQGYSPEAKAFLKKRLAGDKPDKAA